MGIRWARLLALAVLFIGVLAALTGGQLGFPRTRGLLTDSADITDNTLSTDTLNAPTSLTASGGTSVNLNWTATTDSYASGHRVLRGTASGGPYTQIAQVTPRTNTSYTDNPSPGTYYYVVRAFFQNWESGNSNEVTATLTPPPIVHEEVETGGSSGSSTVSTTAALTAVSNHLYLASISMKPNVAVTSVTGLGLTWTLVDARCAARGQTRVEVWKAQGTPTGNGTVTANLTSAPLNTVIAVSRYSGVSTTSPIGSVTSANTLGVDGACSGGTDTASYSVNLTTTSANSVAYGAVAIRLRTHTPGAGYTEYAEVAQGSSGDVAGVAVEARTVASPSTVAVNGTLSRATDWAIIAIEIKQ